MKLRPRYTINLRATFTKLSSLSILKPFPFRGFSIVISSQTHDRVGSDPGFLGFNRAIIFEIDIHDHCGLRPHMENHHYTDYIDHLGSQNWIEIPNFNFKESGVFYAYLQYFETYNQKEYYRLQDKYENTYSFRNNYNHIDYFGASAYMGFVGYKDKDGPQLKIDGSYICEDPVSDKHVINSFTIPGSAQVGTRIDFTYYPKNVDGDPSGFVNDFETVQAKFEDSTGCFITQDTADVNQRRVSFYCLKVGTKKIGISTSRKGVSYKTITFTPKNPNKVVEYGHDGKAFNKETEIIKRENDRVELRYNGKRFIYQSDFSSHLEVIAYDEYDNIYSGNGVSESNLRNILQISVTKSCIFTKFSAQNNRYRIYFKVITIGPCEIKFGNLNAKTYYFDVLPSIPDPKKSSCTLEDYSSVPTLPQLKDFKYRCILKDTTNYVVSPKNSATIYGIKYSARITKDSPNKNADGVVLTKIDDTSSNQYITLHFQTRFMGQYKVEALINNQPITNTGINSVKVESRVLGFTNAKFKTVADQNWNQKISSINYKAENEGLLLLIDFTDSDNITAISTYNYASNFNPKESIKAEFSYSHNQKKIPEAPVAELYNLGNKQYIAIKYKTSTENYIKKNSLPLTLTLTFNSQEYSVNFNYPLDIAPYITCLNDLNLDATKVYVKTNKFVAGNQYEYLTITLMNDNSHIHNYKESVELRMNNNTQNKLTIFPHKKIEGIYEVEISVKEAGQFTFQLIVVNENVKNMSFTVLPNKAASVKLLPDSPYIMEDSKTFKRKTVVNTDDDILTEFNLFDYLGNLINVGMKVDVEIKMIVNGKTLGQKQILGEEHFSKGHYTYLDKTYEIGEYEIRLEILSNGDIYSFKYTKEAGKISRDIVKVIYEDNLLYPPGIVHSVDIYYYKSKDNLVTEESNVKRLMENTQISVIDITTQNPATFSYSNSEVTSDFGIKFYTSVIESIGKYKVTVMYSGKIVSTFVFEVGYETISTENSKLMLKTTTEKLMLHSSSISINKNYDYPRFIFYYYNEKNNPIYSFTSNPNLNARIEGNGINSTLEASYNNPNGYAEFEYSGNISQIQNGLYFILISLNDQVDTYSNYSIYIVDQKEVVEESPYVVKNTYFPFKTLKTIAGVKESFIIELKTENFKRYNKPVTISMIKVIDTRQFIEKNLTKVEFSITPINGQFEVSIIQIGVGTNSYIFSIIDPQDSTKWQDAWFHPTIITRNAALGSLEISSDNIVSGSQLKDGIAGQPSLIKIIPKDIYGNIYLDFFDEQIIQKNFRNSLFEFSHSNFGAIKLDYSYDYELSELLIELSTPLHGIITLSSPYFTNKYTKIIKAGLLDISHSEAKFENNYEVKAGTSNIPFKILPKDEFGNVIESISNDTIEKIKIIANNEESGNTFNVSHNVYESPYIIYYCTFQEVGTITVKATLDEVEFPCSECILNVIEDKFDPSKTVVIVNDIELDKNEKNEIDTSSYPIIKVKLFDQFNNQKEEINDVEIEGSINDSSIKFDLIPSKGNKLIYLLFDISNKSVRDEWIQLKNGEYKLNLKINQQDYTYTLTITNKRNTDEESLEPLNNTLTSFIPEKVDLIAGQKIIIEMRQFGNDGKRYNKWYDTPSSSIKVSLNNQKCTNQIYYGSNPGIYLIELQCTRAYKSDTMKITVENSQLEKIIPVTVLPSSIKSLKLSNIKSSVSVNDYMIFTITPYDVYENIVNVDTKAISYKIKSPSNIYVSSIIIKNYENNSFNVKVAPKEAGEYTVESVLLPTTFKFTANTSNYNAANSRLIVQSNTANAGDQIEIYIIPFDDQNNYKEADVSNCPYKLTYKYTGANDIEIKEVFIREYTYNGKKV
jgi:hypothetical protein